MSTQFSLSPNINAPLDQREFEASIRKRLIQNILRVNARNDSNLELLIGEDGIATLRSLKGNRKCADSELQNIAERVSDILTLPLWIQGDPLPTPFHPTSDLKDIFSLGALFNSIEVTGPRLAKSLKIISVEPLKSFEPFLGNSSALAKAFYEILGSLRNPEVKFNRVNSRSNQILIKISGIGVRSFKKEMEDWSFGNANIRNARQRVFTDQGMKSPLSEAFRSIKHQGGMIVYSSDIENNCVYDIHFPDYPRIIETAKRFKSDGKKVLSFLTALNLFEDLLANSNEDIKNILKGLESTERFSNNQFNKLTRLLPNLTLLDLTPTVSGISMAVPSINELKTPQSLKPKRTPPKSKLETFLGRINSTSVPVNNRIALLMQRYDFDSAKVTSTLKIKEIDFQSYLSGILSSSFNHDFEIKFLKSELFRPELKGHEHLFISPDNKRAQVNILTSYTSRLLTNFNNGLDSQFRSYNDRRNFMESIARFEKVLEKFPDEVTLKESYLEFAFHLNRVKEYIKDSHNQELIRKLQSNANAFFGLSS